MKPDEFRREYLLRLPLPIAQLYGRSYNAKSPRERHDNAFYLFEALVKLAASTATAYYLEEVASGQTQRVPSLDRQLAQLALPSLGQWLSILRELSRHFHSRVDRETHPWGKQWSQLSKTRKDLPSTLALFNRLKNGPDGELATDQTCSIYQLLEGLVQYRNSVFGHGAGRFETFYADEMGPLLFPAINEVLDDWQTSILGPPSARLVYIAELRVLDDGRAQIGMRELVGNQGSRIAPLELESHQAEKMLPNRVALTWPGRAVPLRLDPMLQYRESELSEEILFLNRDRNGKQVEYLSYTTGKTDRDRSMLPALAKLLSEVTNQSVTETDLQRFSEQSLAESPSVETLFAPKILDPQTTGEYELLSELGRGGMGVVYLARQSSLGRLVALKMLPQDLSQDEVSLARFRREIRNLASCDDPHIVKILSSGTFPDGRLYYTMEYVPGSDLEMVWRELTGPAGLPSNTSSTLLKNATWTQAVLSASRRQREKAESSRSRTVAGGDTKKLAGTDESSTIPLQEKLPLPPLPQIPSAEDDVGGYVRHIVLLARDVAKALQSIHDQGIIHRDVKPANLVLTPDGERVVLMDFGLAKGQANSIALSQHGGLLGTLRYAAPEQLAAANIQVGPPADVRGLGVTMWELLTRRRLFGNAEDELSLTQEVLASDVPRLRSIDSRFDRDLDAIVARATARRISDRIPTASQLADLLQLWLDGKPIPIRLPTISEQAFRWLREHAALATTTMLITVLAMTTLGITLRDRFQRSRHSQEAWQQVSQQSRQLFDFTLPEYAKELQHPDVDIGKLQSMLRSLRQQSRTIRGIAEDEGLNVQVMQRAQAKAEEIEDAVHQLALRTYAVERLQRGRVLRFQISEEAFKSAGGMPVIYGRDGIDIYRQVFSELAGTEILSEESPPASIVEKLKEWDISEHLRMAFDDWFVLSYGIGETPIRQRLASLVDLLDQGEGNSTRSALRQAFIEQDFTTMENIGKSELESNELSQDRLSTRLLLVDGLLENLRLGEAKSILRQMRDASLIDDEKGTQFSRFWLNQLLGLVLNRIGTRDEIHEAIQCFIAASAIDPSNEETSLGRANSEIRLARPMKAVEILQSIRDPNLQSVRRISLGVAYANAGHTQKAREIVHDLIKNDPDSVLAHHGAAVIMGELFEQESAKEFARQGLKIDPEHPDLMWWAYSNDPVALKAELAKIPPQKLDRFWLAKFSTEVERMQKGHKERDSVAVALAREELRQLGAQDWQMAWQEYSALLTHQNWNGDSWEEPLRQLHEEAPSLLAEQAPSPILGTFVTQRDFISNPKMRLLLLREIETAPSVYPPSVYLRLYASANLVQYAAPELAGTLYKAAQGQIVRLQNLGYGSTAIWDSIHENLEASIQRTTNPEAIDDRTVKGMKARASAYWQLGQARLGNNDFEAARTYLKKYLTIAEEMAKTDPNDLDTLREVSYANAWLSNLGFSMEDFDSAYEYSKKDIENSERMAKSHPGNPSIESHLARAYLLMVSIENARGHQDDAREFLLRAKTIYESLAEANPLDGSIQGNLLLCYERLGRESLNANDLEGAANFLRRCLPIAEKRAKGNPNNLVIQVELADIHSQLGHVLLLQRKVDESFAHLEATRSLVESHSLQRQEATLLGHDSTQVYFYLALAHVVRRELPKAIENYDKDIATKRNAFLLQPGNSWRSEVLATHLSYRGALRKELGEFAEAEKDLNEAISLKPDVASHWHERASIRYLKDDVEGAIADDTEAIRLKPEEADFYVSRAQSLAWVERYEASIADYTEAIRIRPDDLSSYRSRADSYFRVQQYEKSLADLDKVTERTDPVYWLIRTELLEKLGRQEEAIAASEKISELGFENADMLNQAGIWKLRFGNIEAARQLFLKAVAVTPNHFSAQRHVAVSYAAEEEWEKAAKEYNKCIELGLTYPLSWSEAELVARVRGEMAESTRLLDSLLQKFWQKPAPNDFDSVAWAVARFGSPPQSKEVLTKLVALGATPGLVLTERTRAALHLRLGEWAESESVLQPWKKKEETRNDHREMALLAIALAHQGKSAEANNMLELAKGALLKYQQERNPYTAIDGKVKWISIEEAKLLIAEGEQAIREAATQSN